MNLLALFLALQLRATPKPAEPPLADWTLDALHAFAPLERQARNPWADATIADGAARYVGIRDAIVAVCTDKRCAALLVALAVGESGLARDADVGPCYRKGAFANRCDRGRAASVWQVQAFGEDAGGRITVERLFADRKLAAGRARAAAFGSLARCKHLDPADRLANLGGGNCKPSPAATARWHLWQRVLGWKPAAKRPEAD